MKRESLIDGFCAISKVMTENKDNLIELDARNGDGDLGISMAAGYEAVCSGIATLDETDLGKIMMKAASVFNEAAPSSLGTITSFGMMGMAKALKGKTEVGLPEFAQAMMAGVEHIMEKAESKPGEKTILDAIYPGAQALCDHSQKGEKEAWQAACDAAKAGAKSTEQMRSVHGRAAYYGDKSIGLIDGGAVVGSLIFEAIVNSL